MATAVCTLNGEQTAGKQYAPVEAVESKGEQYNGITYDNKGRPSAQMLLPLDPAHSAKALRVTLKWEADDPKDTPLFQVRIVRCVGSLPYQRVTEYADVAQDTNSVDFVGIEGLQTISDTDEFMVQVRRALEDERDSKLGKVSILQVQVDQLD